jgi:DNA-binding Lrp family transcriptional regulator
MDETDRKILNEIQIDAKRSVSDLAKLLNLPRTTINNRIKKFETDETILKYKAVLNMKKIGKSVTAIVHIVINSSSDVHEVARKLKKKANVEEVYIIAGQFDIIAKIRLKNNEELSDFIFNPKTGLRSWPSVERTESMIVLDAVKENGEIEV